MTDLPGPASLVAGLSFFTWLLPGLASQVAGLSFFTLLDLTDWGWTSARPRRSRDFPSLWLTLLVTWLLPGLASKVAGLSFFTWLDWVRLNLTERLRPLTAWTQPAGPGCTPRVICYQDPPHSDHGVLSGSSEQIVCIIVPLRLVITWCWGITHPSLRIVAPWAHGSILEPTGQFILSEGPQHTNLIWPDSPG